MPGEPELLSTLTTCVTVDAGGRVPGGSCTRTQEKRHRLSAGAQATSNGTLQPTLSLLFESSFPLIEGQRPAGHLS